MLWGVSCQMLRLASTYLKSDLRDGDANGDEPEFLKWGGELTLEVRWVDGERSAVERKSEVCVCCARECLLWLGVGQTTVLSKWEIVAAWQAKKRVTRKQTNENRVSEGGHR